MALSAEEFFFLSPGRRGGRDHLPSGGGRNPPPSVWPAPLQFLLAYNPQKRQSICFVVFRGDQHGGTLNSSAVFSYERAAPPTHFNKKENHSNKYTTSSPHLKTSKLAPERQETERERERERESFSKHRGNGGPGPKSDKTKKLKLQGTN